MTPKEKAKELFDKYCWAIRIDETDSGYFSNVIYAKDCALIAVDEMILVLPFTNTNATLNEYAIHLQKYLEQVKHEIEQL
jgi:hypothetical protein